MEKIYTYRVQNYPHFEEDIHCFRAKLDIKKGKNEITNSYYGYVFLKKNNMKHISLFVDIDNSSSGLNFEIVTTEISNRIYQWVSSSVVLNNDSNTISIDKISCPYSDELVVIEQYTYQLV